MAHATKKKKIKVLLTGSAGYIGTKVMQTLSDKFDFVKYDIRHHPSQDVRNLKSLEKAVKGVDGVVHLAAISRPKWGFKNPHECLHTNILGTVNVLEAVRRVNPKAWVVFGSSREVFGNLKKTPADETHPRRPLNAYAVSKMTGEDLLRQYAENYGLRCLTLRFCGVYSGKDDILDRVVPLFIRQAISGKPITVEGNGKRVFDFVYIDDTVDGIKRAMKYIATKSAGFYDHITLARQDPISLKGLASTIVRLTGNRSIIKHHPDRTYDQDGFHGTFAKASALLGWEPKMALEDGLKKAINELSIKEA